MGAQPRRPHRLGLATGRRPGLCRGRSGRAGLPLLGPGVERAGPALAGFSPTSRRCSRPFCRRCSWARHRSPFTSWPSS
jgi:hypothetical protein